MKKNKFKKGVPFVVRPMIVSIDGVKRPPFWKPLERNMWDTYEKQLMNTLTVSIIPKPVGLQKRRKK